MEILVDSTPGVDLPPTTPVPAAQPQQVINRMWHVLDTMVSVLECRIPVNTSEDRRFYHVLDNIHAIKEFSVALELLDRVVRSDVK